MLRWMGYKQVGVNTIVLPGEVKRRKTLPHVVELAKSIAELGDEPIHAPTIANRTRKLIAGRDRMAALLINGVKSCWVRVVEGTPQELADLEVDENLHRRHDNRDELIARRVAKVEGQIEAEIEAGALPDTASGNAGRPKTPRGLAREKVARELGTTPEAVRAAENRATSSTAADDSQKPREVLPTVVLWGIPETFFPDGELSAAQRVQVAIDAADAKLKAAQAALAALKEGCGQVGHRTHALLYEQVHQVADAVRRARPEFVCPYCKYLPTMRPTCSGCAGIGFVSGDLIEACAVELTHFGDDAKVIDGRGGFVLLSVARANGQPRREPIKPQPKPAPASKTLNVQDKDGRRFNPETEQFEDDDAPL